MEDYIYSQETVGAYKTPTGEFSGVKMIKRVNVKENTITWIPVDEENSDYRQYLLDTKKK